ncbi:MAG: desulfoferrodoxin FeS4 iron-binding domain-containing protein [Bacillota bacterium]|nr:desulfoferrodoxin FeS4 iron-binding domain-containing protein [Bacillota bacterium]
MATKKEEVYECQVCSNVVKVINAGVGTLVCCDKPMKLREKGK